MSRETEERPIEELASSFVFVSIIRDIFQSPFVCFCYMLGRVLGCITKQNTGRRGGVGKEGRGGGGEGQGKEEEMMINNNSGYF